MKVYILIWNFEMGGAQKFVVKLANAHNRLGNDVTLLVSNPSGPFREMFDDGINIKTLQIPNTNNPLGLITLYKKLKSFIEKESMVVINGPNNFRQIGRLNFFARRWNLIFRLHNDIIIGKSFLAFLKRFEMRLLFNQKRVRVLSMSEKQMKDHIATYHMKRIRHIPNFFPKVEMIKKNENSLEINAICMSRLSEEKGVQVLVPAMSLVKCDIKLDIFGKGPLMEGILTDIDRLDLKNVIFKAPVLNVEETLLDYNFLILPSLSETFGNAVVDALNVGIPVVTTDTDGPLNLIEDGVNGVIAKKGDQESLAAAIDRMVEFIQRGEFEQESIKSSLPDTYREEVVMKQHMELFED